MVVLQKFRLSLKREQDAVHESINRGSTLEHVASHNLLSPLSAQEGVLQFSNLQSMMVSGQPDINGLIQENLNGHIPIPSRAPLRLLNHVVSNHNVASAIEFGQQALCSDQLDSANPECYQTGDPNNEGLVDFPQIEGWEFLDGETDSNPSNFRVSVLEKLLRSPPVLPEPLQVPPPPQEQDVFGAERGREFDDLLTVGKGTSQPLDVKDFDNFW